MKVVIHNLSDEYENILKEKCDYVIKADGKYSGCKGCFGCWTKHPAECYIKDSLKQVCRIIGQADELIIITDNFYGTYSPEIKCILDRSIGVSTPMSTYRANRCTILFDTENIISGKILSTEMFLKKKKKHLSI